jgi:uncharacterized protein with ParB-like and HNH nuclease domain
MLVGMYLNARRLLSPCRNDHIDHSYTMQNFDGDMVQNVHIQRYAALAAIIIYSQPKNRPSSSILHWFMKMKKKDKRNIDKLLVISTNKPQVVWY